MSNLNKYLKYKKKYLDLKMKGGGEILENAFKALNEYHLNLPLKIYLIFYIN